MIIGIDPDFKASGVAIMRDGVIEELLNVKLWDMPAFIRAHAAATFVLENVNKDSCVYDRNKGPHVMMKIAQDVGRVKATCSFIEQALEDAGVKYIMADTLKGPLCKVKKEEFNRKTGWKGQSNQDQRDAGMLAWAYQ